MTVRRRTLHGPLSLLLLWAGPAWALSPGDRSIESAPGLLAGALEGEDLGASLALLGDLDGDGVGDFALGAPSASEDAGRVYLLSGALLAERRFVALPEGALLAGEAGARFGATVTGPGDLDGDGIGDLVVGAPGHPGNDTPEGRLYVYSGGPGLLSGEATTPLVVVDGPTDGARLGEVVAAAGDADGDGRADIAVVVRDGGVQSTSGRVVIVPGRPAGAWGTSTGFESRAAWSFAVEGLGDAGGGPGERPALAGAGDRDGDGADDLWLGRPADSVAASHGGGLLLLPGAAGAGVLDGEEAALAVLHGGEPGQRIGSPLSVRASDGRLWAGAEGAVQGLALAFDGGMLSFPVARILGAGVGGVRVLAADLDGDGVAGELAAQPRAEGPFVGGELAGALGVSFGDREAQAELDLSDAVFWGPGGARLGAALAVANLDGDGYDDVIVGAPGAHGTGAIYVLRGAALADGDGFTPREGDCDDLSPAVHPAMAEICDDGLDNDCNGYIDGIDAPCALADAGITVGCGLAGGGGGAAALLMLALGLGFRRRRWLGLLLLAGCGAAAVDEPITLSLVEPAEPFRVEGLHLPVAVEVEGARLAPEDPPIEGALPAVRWRLSVDGIERAVTGGPLHVVSGLDPGVHAVDVELVDALDEQPFDPPILDSLTVEVVTVAPSIALVEPVAGAILAPEGFDVVYDVQGVTLDEGSVGGPNQVGVGHVVVSLDGALFARDADGRVQVVPPSEGAFQLAVEVVQNDGTPLDPPVIASRSVEVASPRILVSAPEPGATVAGPGVSVAYDVEGFVLDPVNLNGGTPTPGVGHVHIYLDDVYSGIDADGAFELPDVDGCEHELALVLALVNHQEVGDLVFVPFSYEPCVFVDGLADGAQVTGTSLDLGFGTRGFELEGDGPSAPVGRHVHRYLDGQFLGDSTAGSAAFDGLTPGDHVLELRLADEALAPGALLPGAQELDPRASARISITVLGG
jgi:hypothetical protein